MFEKIKNFFTTFDWSVTSIAKVAGAALAGIVGLIVVLFALSVLMAVGRQVLPFSFGGSSYGVANYARSAPAPMMAPSYGGMGLSKMALSESAGMAQSVSSDMAMPQMPYEMPSVNGSRNSELYQHTGYSASYETNKVQETCTTIEDLRPLPYVYFDTSSQGERSCAYTFRVDHDHADEVVAKLKALNPKDWSVNAYTVAQNIENYQDRAQELERRLASIDQTLKEAEAAFSKLTIEATQSGRVSDLTAIITERLSTVERLTNEKLSLEDQIHQLSGNSSDQIDETKFAYFTVSVSKWSYIDWQSIKDGWRSKLQSTIWDMNETLAAIVLSIPSFILTLVWYALYIGILIIAGTAFVKLMMTVVRAIWR